MNGENLVYDYRFNVVESPTDWAFNWDYAECGTSKPTPRNHHATMWLIVNLDDPLTALQSLFKQLSKKGKYPMVLKLVRSRIEEDEDLGEYYYLFRVIHRSTKETLFEGRMEKPKEEGDMNDPNVGHFTLFSSRTKKGTEVMKYIADNTSFGHCAFIPHEKTVLSRTVDDDDNTYEVVAITGEGPEDLPRPPNSLGTRFNLFRNQEEVARCYMSYRDGSHDPSTGPTLEMIAVHQDYRGKGLAKLLWYWVLIFIERNFTLECMNNDSPVGHIMVKATQIANDEVEMRRRKRDKKMAPVGFKEFVYNFCGFSVREQKGAMAYLMGGGVGGGRPKDEEATLYIPLVPREQLKIKAVSDAEKAPKPGKESLRTRRGRRACMWCRELSQDLMSCSLCEVAHYCNRSCQKKDWKRHKKWCCKTRDEVKELLIEEGGMVQMSDGRYSLDVTRQMNSNSPQHRMMEQMMRMSFGSS